jgi:molybdopterin converting factor small subunit
MQLTITFYSYFKDLAGCGQTVETVAEGITLGALVEQLTVRFPKLAPMRRAMLVAVGVDYQNRAYVLKEGDEVALFPPVQGG